MEKFLQRLREEPRLQIATSVSTLLLGVGIELASDLLPSDSGLKSLADILGLISVIIGLVGTAFSITSILERLVTSIENKVGEMRRDLRMFLIVPGYHPLSDSNIAFALRRLTDMYWRLHSGGYTPIKENITREIEISPIIGANEKAAYDIPEIPESLQWLWLRFRTKETWDVRPVFRGQEEEVGPEISIGPLIVSYGDTFVKMRGYGLHTYQPQLLNYYPVPTSVVNDTPVLRSVFDECRFLWPIGGKTNADPSIYYDVALYEDDYEGQSKIIDKRSIRLERHKDTAIANKIITGFSDLPSQVKSELASGFLELFSFQSDWPRKKLCIKVSERVPKRFWRITLGLDYLIPAKIIKESESTRNELLSFDYYVWDFSQISIVNSLRVCTVLKPFELYPPLLFSSLPVVTHVEPATPRSLFYTMVLPDHDKKNHIFPSDQIYIRWDDRALSNIWTP